MPPRNVSSSTVRFPFDSFFRSRVSRITRDFMYVKLPHYKFSLVINYLTEIKYEKENTNMNNVFCNFSKLMKKKKKLKESDLIKSREEFT